MQRRDWETAYRQYELAKSHLLEVGDEDFRKECATGMAQARYESAKQALKESNREAAVKFAEDALKLRHPHAGALLDGLKSEMGASTATDASEIRHRRNDEDYKKDRDLIRQRLRLSSQYLAVADIDRAIEQCDLVLRSDPYNKQALALRESIQRRRQIIAEKEREATRNGMIADVSKAWRPVYAIDSMEVKGVDGGTMKTPVGGDPVRSVEQSIEKRMKEMILPSIAFRPPATIGDAVDFFRQASKDFDRPEIPQEQRGFNFVLRLDKTLTGDAAAANGNTEAAFGAAADDDANAASGPIPQIPNISAANISLWEAMTQVCKISGFKFKIQGSFVVVMPKDMTIDELITRSYNVVEDFVTIMSGASSNLKNEQSGQLGGGGGGNDNADDGNDEEAWKKYFEEMGVTWPQGARIRYLKHLGKVRVTNTADQLAIFEQALSELSVTPMLVEIETRFVEVAQEDLNSLGFEWLLNTDYSFNVGGKLKKVLNLKDGAWNLNEGYSQVDGTRKITTTETVEADWASDGNGTRYIRNPDMHTGPTVNAETTENYQWQKTLGWTNIDPDTGERYSRRNGPRTRTNMGVSAVNGTDYSSGMRYLSTDGNHIAGQGTSINDRFMKVNAFLGNADLSMILHMLSQRSDTDLLSAPKVVTKSGQEATIKVVTIYRYPQDYDVTIQSSSGSSGSDSYGYSRGGGSKILPMVEPQNFETQEVGVILTCTPEISSEGQMINLTLNPKVISEPEWKDYGMKVPMASVMPDTSNVLLDPLTGVAQAFSDTSSKDMEWYSVPMEQPFFKERSIDTHVSLYNGATIVMGGLITEERKSMEDKIPFLGDIPFIGRIFRSRSEWSNKRNLLIFVTARLVDPRGRQVMLGTDDEAEPAGKKEAGVTPAPNK